MTALLILFGLLLPTFSGWLLLGLIQNKTPVLFRGERMALGFLFGTTLTMFVLFCTHIVFGLSLSFWPFFIIQIGMTLLLAGIMFWKKIPFLSGNLRLTKEQTPSSLVHVLIAVLGAWSALKVLMLGVTFLFLTPTYFDDSVDNWNLRAKVFYHTQSLELSLPGRTEPVADVSSYPPTVPMAKAWLAMTAGWSDVAVNAIHFAWFLCVLSLIYFSLRRYMPCTWALLGLYGIISMPLYLMHGTNTYADVFMGAHAFAAAVFLFHAIRAQVPAERSAYFRIGAVAAALLPFTKNEGLLIFLPPILLLLCVHLGMQWRKKAYGTKDILGILLWYAVSLLLILVPWLWYKYAFGLTFANAKGVSDLAFGWQPGVLYAVAVNTLFEGNWILLFPVFVALLVLRWRTAFTALLPLTALFLIVYLGQLGIYLFTSISIEALKQTGYARGIIQLMPVAVFLTVMLLKDAYDTIKE